MIPKSDYLIDSIFRKLKNYKAKPILLEKENLKKFIFSLLKENWMYWEKLPILLIWKCYLYNFNV